jgi:hypothetical protein
MKPSSTLAESLTPEQELALIEFKKELEKKNQERLSKLRIVLKVSSKED